MKKPRLGVNIDHVATLARLRDTAYPDLLRAADECVAGGAEQITVHLREDRRHIQDRDVRALMKHIKVDLNLEIAATQEMLDFALELQPHSICIVPEKREERTTEGGLDLRNPKRTEFLKRMAHEAGKAGIIVSLFIEPSVEDVRRSKDIGAKSVELHTGALCIAYQAGKKAEYEAHMTAYKAAVAEGLKGGMIVCVGHGIDLACARELAKVPGAYEYNIGHAIVCDAVFVGLREATSRMKKAIQS